MMQTRNRTRDHPDTEAQTSVVDCCVASPVHGTYAIVFQIKNKEDCLWELLVDLSVSHTHPKSSMTTRGFSWMVIDVAIS